MYILIGDCPGCAAKDELIFHLRKLLISLENNNADRQKESPRAPINRIEPTLIEARRQAMIKESSVDAVQKYWQDRNKDLDERMPKIKKEKENAIHS